MIISFRLVRTVVSKKCNEAVCARVHKFANTIECNNVVSSSTGFACPSWNFIKIYDLDVAVDLPNS